MKEDIREYARLGICYQLLYPRCAEDMDYYERTFAQFLTRTDIETLDCGMPYGDERRRRLIPAVRSCGKEVVLSPHLFPVRKLPLGSSNPGEQGVSRLAYADQIAMSAAIGAYGMIIYSGPDFPEDKRAAAQAVFADFCRWFCGELKRHGIVGLLEPMDRTFDKKALYGSSEECVALIRSLEPEVDNFGIVLDMAHVPMMHETFEHAIKTCLPYTWRVHLGNCVMKDPTSRFYGDMHAPIGIEGGEIDVPQLTEILGLLLEYGYLRKEKRGALILEVQPFPGMSEDESIADNMDRVKRAWAAV